MLATLNSSDFMGMAVPVSVDALENRRVAALPDLTKKAAVAVVAGLVTSVREGVAGLALPVFTGGRICHEDLTVFGVYYEERIGNGPKNRVEEPLLPLVVDPGDHGRVQVL